MAYFANGTEGMKLDESCDNCILGGTPCPVAAVQMAFNYEAVVNKTATSILNSLIHNDGTCEVQKLLSQ